MTASDGAARAEDQAVALSTRELSKTFGATRTSAGPTYAGPTSAGPTWAVKGITLAVNRGEMLALVGPDGAGKTTLIRMLTGVLPPTSGTASVLGHDLVTGREEIRRSIGYLSQVFSLYGDLTVDENIEFFAQIHNVVDFRGRRDELLAFTRLEPFRRRLAGDLSGGMKQKLGLACTLIHSPDLILLDEPTTGVDPVSRRDFWLILAELLRQKITIVLATPYLDEAERCHSVALMHEGSVIRREAPAAITEAFPGSLLEVTCPHPHEAVRAVRQTPGWEGARLFGTRLHVSVSEAGTGERELRAVLERNGIPDASVREIRPTLEDAFIAEIAKLEQSARTPF